MSAQPQIPEKMKAIQVDKTGGPEVNVLREIDTPKPKEGEVLIKVHWSGVNFIDVYFRTGIYPKTFPYTVGQDAVGTIVSIPSSESKLKVGQKVYTTAANAFAEYLVAPLNRVAALPDDVEPKDGVSLATLGLTALTLAKESYPIKQGDWVFITAAAGGVGLILTQVAKHLGAKVIATTSSEAKAEIVKQNGADHVLLTTLSSEERVKQVLKITQGRGVQAVYDSVGKDTWEEAFEVVGRKGTIVTYGNASGPVPAFMPLKLIPKALKVTRPTLHAIVNTQEEWNAYTAEATDLHRKGVTKFAVHKVYDFSEDGVRQAQIDIAGRGTSGKLLVHVSD